MHLFRALVDGAKLGESFRGRVGGKKADEQFAWVDVATPGEGVTRNNIAHFGGGAVNHAGAKAESKFNGFFDACGKSGKVAVASAENDVAAIDIGLAAGELQRFIKSAKGLHFDLIAADDVDAAEQRNDGGHGAKYTTKSRRRDNAESNRYA